MNKEELVKKFNKAKELRCSVAVWLTVPTQNRPEIIITDKHNLQYKLDYYLKAYDDTLTLKNCKDIKILDIKIIKNVKFLEVTESETNN